MCVWPRSWLRKVDSKKTLAQLYITFQKASELKNNSHLFYIYDYSFLFQSFFFTLFCASRWFLSPGLISFGGLAWSLEGKMVLLLLKIALISILRSSSWGWGWWGWG